MQNTVLQLDPRDNVLVALKALRKGESVSFSGSEYTLLSDIPAKHKFVTKDLAPGERIIMYGGLVGTMSEALQRGDLLSTKNLRHAASDYHSSTIAPPRWTAPDVPAIPFSAPLEKSCTISVRRRKAACKPSSAPGARTPKLWNFNPHFS